MADNNFETDYRGELARYILNQCYESVKKIDSNLENLDDILEGIITDITEIMEKGMHYEYVNKFMAFLANQTKENRNIPPYFINELNLVVYKKNPENKDRELRIKKNIQYNLDESKDALKDKTIIQKGEIALDVEKTLNNLWNNEILSKKPNLEYIRDSMIRLLNNGMRYERLDKFIRKIVVQIEYTGITENFINELNIINCMFNPNNRENFEELIAKKLKDEAKQDNLLESYSEEDYLKHAKTYLSKIGIEELKVYANQVMQNNGEDFKDYSVQVSESDFQVLNDEIFQRAREKIYETTDIDGNILRDTDVMVALRNAKETFGTVFLIEIAMKLGDVNYLNELEDKIKTSFVDGDCDGEKYEILMQAMKITKEDSKKQKMFRKSKFHELYKRAIEYSKKKNIPIYEHSENYGPLAKLAKRILKSERKCDITEDDISKTSIGIIETIRARNNGEWSDDAIARYRRDSKTWQIVLITDILLI